MDKMARLRPSAMAAATLTGKPPRLKQALPAHSAWEHGHDIPPAYKRTW